MAALDDYGPFDAGIGANRTEDFWRAFMRNITGSGVIDGELNGLAVAQHAAGANMSVDVATGRCFVAGHWGECTIIKNPSISAAHATLARIDRVVLRADFTANTVSVEVLTGTAAANPTVPSLTQNTAMWETPLARVAVAAAATTIVTANITDERVMLTYGGREGMPGKRKVRAATTAALATNSYSSGVLTASSNGALAAQDGVTLAVGDDLLVKNESTGANNGIYTITSIGSASSTWSMTRRNDADTSAKLSKGVLIQIDEGTTLADALWQLTTNSPITLGTTSLTFAAVGGSASSGGPALIMTVVNPATTTQNAHISNSNRAIFARVMKGGTITAIGIEVTNQSGNISAAVCRGTVGRAAPTSRVVTTGAISCPAVGFASLTVSSTVVDETTDWLALSADNTTATFKVTTGTAAGGTNMQLGVLAYQDTAHPIPSSPSTSTFAAANVPIMIGVP